MLIRFAVSNFLSFDEEVELSMYPGPSKQHPEHIIKDERWNGINLLRAAVIYGANASGKSNLVKALDFAKLLIVKGTRPQQSIPVEQHKLNPECATLPSCFKIEFKSNGCFYTYGFELDRERIHTEWLYKITKKSQKLLFERTTRENKVAIEFGDVGETKDDEQFLEFVARGTRPNQLFLTESIERNVTFFKDAIDWFSKVLQVIFPQSRYHGLEISISRGNELSEALVEYLKLFNTGIANIVLEPIDSTSELSDIPDEIKADLLSKIEPGETMAVWNERGRHRYIFSKDKNTDIRTFKLMTTHKTVNCEAEVKWDITDESDGTLRLMDLIPALYQSRNTERVYIIDELDRSLHPHLSYKILEHFLSNAARQDSQFIVTTHESHLLDLDLLRRDEIWFIEKNEAGASALYSLEEFTPRYDKDIRKGYLLGRFGAIPMIGNISHLGWARK